MCKVKSALDEVVSKMQVASELHSKSLTDLLEYAAKGLSSLTVVLDYPSHLGKKSWICSPTV